MNTITYSVNLETNTVSVSAVVTNGKACGAFEVSREYPFDDFGHWLVEFAQDLRGHYTIHAREYEGV